MHRASLGWARVFAPPCSLVAGLGCVTTPTFPEREKEGGRRHREAQAAHSQPERFTQLPPRSRWLPLGVEAAVI